MDNTDAPPAKPRYRWPWFLLAAIMLGAVLVVIWMSVAVRRVREQRESFWTSPTAPRQGDGTPALTGPHTTNDMLASFRDALLPGDAIAGRKVFFEKPEANCAKCHRVAGQGGDNGPPLDDVGARRSREFILEAMLYPNLHVTTNYETVIVVLKSGAALSGVLKTENETNLVVNTPEDGPVTVRKSEIQLRQAGASPMPEGLGQILSPQDLRNLVEYVAGLKAR